METITAHWSEMTGEQRSKAYKHIRRCVHKRARWTVLDILKVADPTISLCVDEETGNEYTKIENVNSEAFFIALGKYVYLKKLNSKNQLS